MTPKSVYLVTRNPGKLKAARSVFDKYGIKLQQLEIDYPEIQAPTSLEIARYTSEQAAKENNIPVIREDHSIYFNALNFPGPYSNHMEKAVSAEKLLKIIDCFSDRSGYFEIATVYADALGKSIESVFRVPLTITTEIRGEDKISWNSIICIQDEKRALSEYPEEERLGIWGQGYEKIAKELCNLG